VLIVFIVTIFIVVDVLVVLTLNFVLVDSRFSCSFFIFVVVAVANILVVVLTIFTLTVFILVDILVVLI